MAKRVVKRIKGYKAVNTARRIGKAKVARAKSGTGSGGPSSKWRRIKMGPKQPRVVRHKIVTTKGFARRIRIR